MKLTPRLTPFSLCLLLLSMVLGACSTQQRIAKKVDKTFKHSTVVNKYNVGFALYDLEADRMIYGKNEDKYFTPASNTKLFTFYGGLKMLGDSVPALRYVERGDSLIFWSTGDPSLLHAELKSTKALKFLTDSHKQLFYSPGRYTGSFYGNGWSWDDYNDYYQAEISEFPVWGNLLELKSDAGKLSIRPRLFETCFVGDSLVQQERFHVQRDYESNTFHYPSKTAIPNDYTQQVPFKINIATTLNLLSDTLHQQVKLVGMKMPADARTVYSMNKDAVLREMMLPSDNFIAEQLLLVYSNQLSETLSTPAAIKYIKEQYLKELPDQPVWVDGSGLSRGNLFTPRSIVALLKMIYRDVNDQTRLFSMMPAGGKSGTLKKAYPKTDTPFVYGKTGTLSNVHNQSGYVLTRKGKIYLYSFMNNNYVQPTAEIRKEMGRIVTMIHEQF